MKTIIKVIVTVIFMSCTSNQKETAENILLKTLQSNFNASQFDEIYDLYDPSLQDFIPKEQHHQLFREIAKNFGLIEKIELANKRASTHIVTTTFSEGTVDIWLDINEKKKIASLFIPRNFDEHSGILERNKTKIIFPFKEEAFIYWGGHEIAKNYHMADFNQQFAYDILMVANGAPFAGDPTKNESYLVFGKEIIAPCDAKVVKIIDGIPDNPPGEVNRKQPTGNTIVLKTPKNEFLLFAHLKNNSIKVKEGDTVSQEKVIAQCGNSGNSTQAHLHFQLQHTTDIFNTIGAPIYFDSVLVNNKLKIDYMPQKEDFVKNAKNPE